MRVAAGKLFANYYMCAVQGGGQRGALRDLPRPADAAGGKYQQQQQELPFLYTREKELRVMSGLANDFLFTTGGQ